jgi:hypothetical protein
MPRGKQKQAQAENEGTLKRSENQVANSPQEAKVIPEKMLFSWMEAARPFKKRDRDFWVTIIVIVSISGLILFLVEGFMPVILIISIVFLYYILNTVEPGSIEYKITNKGVKVAEKINDWSTLNRFWFTRRFNNDLLVFEANTLGGRLELVINPRDKDKIRKELSKYLVEEEVPPSGFDKAANWFSKKLPGNK